MPPKSLISQRLRTGLGRSGGEKRKRSDSMIPQKPLYQQKCQTGTVTNIKTPSKISTTQRLRTDLGRSVEVATVTNWCG